MMHKKSEDLNEKLISPCYKNSLKTIKNLLDKKADINCVRQDSETPLLIALRAKRIDVAEMLLEKKASVNVKDRFGHNALVVAALYDHDSPKIIQKIIEKKADVSCHALDDGDGDDALIFAARCNHVTVVNLLLEAKADPRYQNHCGKTALIVAALNGSESVISPLLEAKADIGKIDHSDGNDDALQLASFQGHTNIVKLLLAAKANTRYQNKKKETALIQASIFNHPETVALLLEAKADPTQKNKAGHDAMFYASQKNHEKIMALLSQETPPSPTPKNK